MRSGRLILWWRMCSIVGGLCAGLTTGSTVWADVEIQTADGRVLVGQVDSRTTADRLWIRQESESIILATPVRWTSIASAKVDGEPTDVDQLSERWDQLTSETRFGFLAEHDPQQPIHRTAGLPIPAPRVTSLEIEAVLVNLDRDVEPDGYELVIAAVDEYSQNVPVKGSLYVRLVGERNVHHTGRIRFEVFETWNQPVSPHDFSDGLASYVLPFRAFKPEHDFELRPDGQLEVRHGVYADAQLQVRLGVFGEGNFAATVPVPLWNFNPFRDRLQMFEGSRFFRNELSGRPRQHSNDPPGIFSPWRSR